MNEIYIRAVGDGIELGLYLGATITLFWSLGRLFKLWKLKRVKMDAEAA